MRIVQIVTRSDNVGGAQVYLKDLSMALQKRGHSIYVLVGGVGQYLNEMKECGIQVYSLNHLIRPIHPYHDTKAFGQICRALRLLKPDIVVTHTSKAGWLGRVAAWSMGIPVIFTAHGWSFIQVAPKMLAKIYILAEKIAGLLTCCVITVSEYDRNFCLKNTMLPPHKVIAIPNGVPDVEYPLADPSFDKPRFIMTARLEKPKNHLFLFQALASLRDLEWQLDLVGDGPLRSKIEHWLTSFQLQDKVRLLGARRDVPELLSKAQGFILSSDMEGLPLSILEAMRAGLPVVATNVGGVAETIEDGVNGYLVPKGDTDIFTNRLKILIRDRLLRRRMGNASHEKYQKDFRLDNMVERTLAVYSEVRNRYALPINTFNA